MPKINLTRLIAASVMLIAVAACATGPKPVFHSFSYGGSGEDRGVEILNYRYGDSKLPVTRADDAWLADGHIAQANGIGGLFPVGDSLYVKWRVISTGKVYEDTVDLKSRLPSDMDHKRIHFLIKGSQLYVYLITKHGHNPEGPDCPVYTYRDYGCALLYPEHWQNF